MIEIRKSPTADSDFANVAKGTLLNSSRQHIEDVQRALAFFGQRLNESAIVHDADKITDIDGFHAYLVTDFAQRRWWTRHRRINRHHLLEPDGIPTDVNMIDVLDFIADCVMSGMARSGSVYDLELPPELLERAFQNTVAMLKTEVVVIGPEAGTEASS